MHDRKTVALALEAVSLGFGLSQAAELSGARPSAVRGWAHGHLPHGVLGGRAGGAALRSSAARGRRGEGARGEGRLRPARLRAA
ncbi:hypothetical protein, partial [uncultured Olsenella sp.]|uniref:hypothetical protein n=1 Tax=uncultured Olsenella sp. TaxID=190764 RepID=UPI0026DC17C3